MRDPLGLAEALALLVPAAFLAGAYGAQYWGGLAPCKSDDGVLITGDSLRVPPVLPVTEITIVAGRTFLSPARGRGY